MLIKKIHTNRVFFTHAQIRNGRINSNQILRVNSLGGRSNIFVMTSKLVEEFRTGGGAKMGPLPLASNTAYCATAHTRDHHLLFAAHAHTNAACCNTNAMSSIPSLSLGGCEKQWWGSWRVGVALVEGVATPTPYQLQTGLPWIWISMDIIYPCVDIRLRLTIDVSIDISTSFNLNCNITNFEYKIIPLARQFSLRT